MHGIILIYTIIHAHLKEKALHDNIIVWYQKIALF